MAAIARLGGAVIAGRGGAGEAAPPELFQAAESDLRAALEREACPVAVLMPESSCRNLIPIARLWLGWLEARHAPPEEVARQAPLEEAVRQGRLEEAARLAEAVPKSGWSSWFEGRRQFAAGNWAEAAASFEQALKLWKHQEANGSALAVLLAPRADLAQALYRLAEVQFLARDCAGAIATLDQALKRSPHSAETIFLRARAREQAGGAGSMADYELASRTALAKAGEPGQSGQAHLYRGVLLFRRKEYERAESEFASALNFDAREQARADAVAWRHLAAVASGACGASAESLAASLEAASGLFPKDEARAFLDRCRS